MREDPVRTAPEPAANGWRAAWSPEATERFWQYSHGLLRAVLVLSSAYFVGLFLWIASARLDFPFDLEWMEGAMVDHVRFIAEHGHPYVEPTLEFTPFIYNPLYYYVAWAVSGVFGLDYLALRLVSVLSWLGVLGLVFELVRRETRSWLSATLAAGLLAATYAESDGWADLARVDSLLLVLVMGSVFLVRFFPTRSGVLTAAFVLFLGFLTKQVALGLVPPLALYLWFAHGPRRSLEFTLPCLLACGGFVLAMNALSDGWYFYYAFGIPAGHVSEFSREYFTHELFGPFGLALPFVFAFFARRPSADERSALVFHLLLCGSLVGIAVLARAHTGSWDNDNMTAHLALAMLCGLGLRPWIEPDDRARTPLACAAALVLGGQFLLLRYPAKPFIPTAADRVEAEWIQERVREHGPNVYLPHHGHISARNGGPAYAHEMALLDIRRSKVDFRNAKAKLSKQIRRAAASGAFDAIVLDRHFRGYFSKPVIERGYRRADGRFWKDEDALVMRSGVKLRPRMLYLPKGKASGPPP